MAIEYRWAVEESTGIFKYGGAAPRDVFPGLSPGQIRVVLSRDPNPVTERYDPNAAGRDKIRTATPEEIQASMATAKVDAVRATLAPQKGMLDAILAVVAPDIAPLMNMTPEDLSAKWADDLEQFLLAQL